MAGLVLGNLIGLLTQARAVSKIKAETSQSSTVIAALLVLSLNRRGA
jgi:hypothetical protein